MFKIISLSEIHHNQIVLSAISDQVLRASIPNPLYF